MQKLKRNERIGAMIKILSDRPNHIFTLTYFSDMFVAAKSTISEDIDIAKSIMESHKLGLIETVTGAAGGVKYITDRGPEAQEKFVNELCMKLSDPERILPGGYLYMLDVLSQPESAAKIGEVLASWFYKSHPDFVITVQTTGIPVALMAARALNVPLLIARRDVRISDGSLVTINYITGSAKRIQTMSLAKRAVSAGTRALIIDDFMKGGGTAKGMMDMMREFSITVVGVGVVIATREPARKLVSDFKALAVLNNVDETARKIDIKPSKWL